MFFFGETCLQVLGHIVDQFGIHPNPEKVRAVTDFPVPLHVKGDTKLYRTVLLLPQVYTKLIGNHQTYD